MKKLNTSFLTMMFCAVTCFASAQSWSLTGNSGTTSANFIGTKDAKPLIVKTNNTERLRIESGGNVGIGIDNPVQRLDVKGNINLRKGFSVYMENHPVLRVDSLQGNTFFGNGTAPRVSGGSLTAVGYQALLNNTSGSWNTGIGYQALMSNNTGFDNVAVGYIALNVNSNGSGNTAIGNYALMLNNGSRNTASGTGALFSNTSGSDNVANGRFALYNNSTGNYNTAAGAEALNSNTASYNTATGYRALYQNISGYDNVAQGAQALFSNFTGHGNTATGINALYTTTGNYNTAVGDYALFNTADAWGNTAVGDIAGASFHNGYYNTFIGAEADATAADIFNSTALGRATVVTAASQVRIGNSFVNSIGGYANWTNISDGRVKKNIKENVPGLVFINKLKPVTYNLDLDAADKILQRQPRKDKDGKSMAPSQFDINARIAKQQVIYTGFIAQDVEKAAKELKYDFSGVDAAKNDKDLYGLRYAEFVVPLVKAVQELSKQNDLLQKQNNDLESKYENQQKEIDILKAMLTSNSSVVNSQLSTVPSASLSQNVPNPFNSTTKINYTLPQQYSAAKIIITDKSGKTIKAININGTGKGSVFADVSAFASGTYQYSLIVDEKLIDTKQMVLTK